MSSSTFGGRTEAQFAPPVAEAVTSLDGIGAGPMPRPGPLAVIVWWLFLAAIWAPALAFVLLPLLCVWLPALRSPWLLVPWTIGGLLFAHWLARNLRFVQRQQRPPGPRSKAHPRVAVLGAGPVGLAAVKELRGVGAEVDCFDRAGGVGGVYRPGAERARGSTWPSTQLTSSPWVTAFSDFPPTSSSCRHWYHGEYLEYLERYTDAFGLDAAIHLRHEVEEVARDGEAWRVRVRALSTGEIVERRYDHVAVCTGLTETPHLPPIEGLDERRGSVAHTSRYTGPEPYRGKRVVIVGLGESAADIAHEIAQVASEVTLSVERGRFLIPRVNPLTGVANDYDTNRLRYAAPTSVRNIVMRLKRLACAATTTLDATARLRMAFLWASGTGPMSQPATKSDEFLQDVLDGRIRLAAPPIRISADQITYRDGTTASYDSIVLATGYRPAFPFLDANVVETHHPGAMFLRMLVPELGASLAFLGFARPAIGAIPPTGELQARLFAAFVAGHVPVPPPSEMRRSIAEAEHESALSYPTLARPHVIVSWIPFMDQLASYLGCRPRPSRLLRDPLLAWRLMTGPMTGAMYRLDGPGASPHRAMATIRSLPRTHQLGELLTTCLLHFYAHLASLLLRNRRLRAATTFV